MIGKSPHIDITRDALMDVLYEVQATLKWLEVPPGDRPPSEARLELLEQASEVTESAITALQARLQGCFNLARLKYEQSHDRPPYT